MSFKGKLLMGFQGLRAMKKITRTLTNCKKCQPYIIENAQRMKQAGIESSKGQRPEVMESYGPWLQKKLCKNCKKVLQENLKKVVGK